MSQNNFLQMAALGRFYYNLKAADLRMFLPRKNAAIQYAAASCSRSEDLFKHKCGLSQLYVKSEFLDWFWLSVFPWEHEKIQHGPTELWHNYTRYWVPNIIQQETQMFCIWQKVFQASDLDLGINSSETCRKCLHFLSIKCTLSGRSLHCNHRIRPNL